MSDVSFWVDPNLKSYETFWDVQWATGLLEVVNNTPLLPIFDDLLLAWKGAADVHREPWLTIELMKAFARGMTDAYIPFGIKYVSLAVERIGDKVSMTPKKLKKVRTALKVLLQEMKQRNEQTPKMEFAAQEFWNTRLASNQEYGVVLSASQRLCYAALYFGYEHFLLSTYELVSGETDYRIYVKPFAKDLARVFGQTVCDDCWTDPDIEMARLARNALAHCGGRETADLQTKSHGLQVHDGKIFIVPANTKALYDLLKGRVDRVASTAVSLLKKP